MVKKSIRHLTRAGSFYMSLIIFSFFIFSCILALFSITTYEANTAGYTQSLYERARKSTEICAQTLDSITREIVTLRYNPSLINLLRPDINSYLSKEELLKKESELGFILWNSIGQSAYFEGLYIEDINGNGYLENSRIDSCKNTVQDNIANIDLDFTSSKYSIDFIVQNDASCCIITSPIYNNNNLLGYLHVLINNDFFNLVTNNASSGSSEFVYIIDSNTGFPLSVDQNTSWSEGIRLFNTYPENITNILSAKNKKGNIFELYFPVKDFSSIASFYSNDEYSFGTICSVDKNYVMNIVTKYSKIQAVATFVLIILLGFLLIIVYRRNDKPLIDMIKQCSQIANGNEFIRFADQPDKELNILAKTFNKTIESMYTYKSTLEIAAFVDSSLNIENRMKFIKDINHFIDENTSSIFTIYVLDLAQFANFNELFSNAVGDSILKKVCEALLELFDRQVYRISGDVFAMICYHESECNNQKINQIEYFFKHNIIVDNKHYHIEFNIGICSYPQYGTEATVLLERALLALSHVKLKKQKNVAVFNNAILKKIHNDEQFTRLLHKVLSDDSIEVWYQPIYNIQTGEFTSAEALLRVKNFDGSYINPQEIISIAEKSGDIDILGDLILKKSCEMAAKLYSMNISMKKIHVNLSVLQIMQPGFLEQTKKIIDSFSIPHQFIGMEVTESLLIQSFEYAIDILNKLQSDNISLSLDDFGSGYSSINYLSQLPLSTLKLDRELVIQISKSEQQFNLIRAVVEMAKARNLSTIAEGVEDDSTAQLIKECGCDYIQGYLYSRPLSSENFIDFIITQENNHKQRLLQDEMDNAVTV